jgi:ABC-type nitrate/sulfonate/bicarbonate transport system substrate-binding protein
MKIRFIVRCVCLILCLAACSPAVAPPAPTGVARQPVRICTTSTSPLQLVTWYANDKGLFQKYGLEPEVTAISGAPNIAAALLTHQVDFCQSAGSGVVNAVAGGGDLVLVESFYDKLLYGLVVGPDIHTAQDLVGKTIAVGTPRGLSVNAARVGLAHLGLHPDTQVTLQSFMDNEPALMAAAMLSGNIAGAMLVPPLNNQFKADGLHVLLDLSTLDVRYQRVGLGTTRSFIKDHRDIALAVVKANLEAIAMIKQDPAGTQAVLARHLKLDPMAEANTLAEMYDLFGTRYLLSLPYPAQAAVQAVIDEAAATNPDAAGVTVADVVDDSLLREIADSGFLDTLTK